jgi:hypothetical protein
MLPLQAIYQTFDPVIDSAISGFCWRGAVAGLKQRLNFGFRVNSNNAEIGSNSVKSQ